MFYRYLLLCFMGMSFSALNAQHVDQREFLKYSELRTYDVTIDEVKFFFHYKKSQKEFLDKTLTIAKQHFKEIHQYFRYKPKSSVHFMISDDSKFANGLASVFPANTVVLNNYPPIGHGLLSFSKDWIKTLIIHEYIHIVTLEMTEGILGFARFFLGSSAKLAGVIPSWLSEGIATWGESFFSQEGRLRNPAARLQLEEIALDEKACHEIDCIDYQEVHPYGSTSYMVGAFFLEYLENKNKGFLSCLFKKNGRRIPFFLNGAFKSCGGASAASLLSDFWASVRKNKITDKCEALASESCEIVSRTITKHMKGRWVWSAGALNKGKLGVVITNLSEDARSLSQSQKHIFVFNTENGKGNYYKTDYPVEKIYWANKEKSLIAVTFLEGYVSGTARNNIIYKIDQKGHLRKVKAIADSAYSVEANGKWKNLDYKNSKWRVNKKDSSGPIQNLDQDFLSKNQSINYHPSLSLDAPLTVEDKKYNGLRHLNLNYLMFMYSYSGILPFLSISTELSDPYQKHSLALSLDLYQGVDDVTPATGSVLYGLQLSNRLQFGVGYSGLLSRPTGATETNETETIYISLSKSYLKKRYRNSWNLSLLKIMENDFLSSEQRDTNRTDLTWRSAYQSIKLASFLKSFSFSLGTNYSQVTNLESNFMGVQAHTQFNFHLSSIWGLSLRADYGQYFKDTLDDGALYVGGANSTLTGQYNFPAYSLAFQDGFGNEALTSRLEISIELGRPGWGSGFTPLYWHSWNLVGGLEYIKSDIIQDGISVKRDGGALAYFAGVNLNFTAAYNFPLKVKFIYSSLQDSQLENNQFLILIDAPLLP